MLDKSIRILNFDNSVITQAKLLAIYKTEILDLTGLGPRARLWLDKKTKSEVASCIQASTKNAITFLGSGDFHHISHILIEQFSQPLSLIIFDFHPDWDTLPPYMACGSWVTRALRSSNILKCILIGVASCDISGWQLVSANLASLKDNRVEIYPYAHKPSRVFLKKIPKNISLKVKKGCLYNKIYWDELKGKNLREFFALLLKRLATKQVYISIDKDCLKKEYALTNWEEGLLSLEDLVDMLKAIKENLDIVGMDITGDYSKICISGKLKNFFSRLDHPKGVYATKYPDHFVTATNQETNLKILELLI